MNVYNIPERRFKKLIVNFCGNFYEPKKSLTSFNWEAFKQGDPVYFEELFNDDVCYYSHEGEFVRVLNFEPVNPKSLEIFLANSKPYELKKVNINISGDVKTVLFEDGSKTIEYLNQ